MGLLQAAVHAYPQWCRGVGALFEGLHHGDVVDWAVPGGHLFPGDLLEHPALYSLVEFCVELLRAALLGQPLLLYQGVLEHLPVVVLQSGRRDVERVCGPPPSVLLVELQTLQDDLVLLVLFEGQAVGPELALLALAV
jgi:hypothetical protein